MKASDRGRNVKSKELFGCFDEIFISMFNSTKWNFSHVNVFVVFVLSDKNEWWVEFHLSLVLCEPGRYY